MASVLHGSTRTTARIRAELQTSKESARALAARYGLNAKTVRKWRRRTTTSGEPMGPKTPKSTVLTPAEEAIVVAFRQKILLPLIHTVLTGKGMAFADLPKNRDGPSHRFSRPADLRPRLHGKRHRAPVDQALPPVDQRSG